MNIKEAKLALVDDNSAGFVLLGILQMLLGSKVLDWDPSTITLTLKKDFDVEIPDSAFNKIMGARELITSDAFWQDLPSFIDMCNALSGYFDPRVFDPADAGEVAWALTESLILWPPDRPARDEFDEDIITYIQHVAEVEGFTKLPHILQFATPSLDTDPDAQIYESFSDDPVLFKSLHEVASDRVDEINNAVVEQLDYSIEQLERIGFPEEAIKIPKNIRGILVAYGRKVPTSV